jgi:hypothetical protein
MKSFNWPTITVVKDLDGVTDLVSLTFRINDPAILPRLTDKQTMWQLGNSPGFMDLSYLGDGARITVYSRIHQRFTPEEKYCILNGDYITLNRLRSFQPSRPAEFEALGLEIPAEDGDWEWVRVRKVKK